MSDIKSKAQGLDPNVRARDVRGMVSDTKNIYETLSIISKRAKQIAVDMKIELHQKLDEFAVSSDTIEEVHENKEQIEISKYYERLPNPSIIAMDEYLRGQIDFRYINQDNDLR
ncbi:MAG: DNA-directed RNA polymerase subunit omega [Saprospiraceae bacterium]|jgi:DNA-directed RNA polymerase subunit K/omega|nr:DNA-directed RNA polymerase subunit omega [Saprospiraceae bacterium]